VKRIQTKKDKMTKGGSPTRMKPAGSTKRTPSSIIRRRTRRLLAPMLHEEDTDSFTTNPMKDLVDCSMREEEEAGLGGYSMPSSSSDQNWLSIDGHSVVGFPPELIFKLKSLKMLKLSQQIGLIEDAQFISKQEEFLQSFKF